MCEQSSNKLEDEYSEAIARLLSEESSEASFDGCNEQVSREVTSATGTSLTYDACYDIWEPEPKWTLIMNELQYEVNLAGLRGTPNVINNDCGSNYWPESVSKSRSIICTCTWKTAIIDNIIGFQWSRFLLKSWSNALRVSNTHHISNNLGQTLYLTKCMFTTPLGWCYAWMLSGYTRSTVRK